MLIILSAIWGSAFFAIKISVETVNPISVASLRLIIGSLILLIFFNFKIQFKFSKKIFVKLFLIGLIGNFIPFCLISWSEIYIKSNTAGLLLSIGPILALILSHFFTNDDKFNIYKFISVIIGLIGVLFIFEIDLIISEHFLFIPKIAVLIAALGYVLSSIFAYNIKDIDSKTLTTLVTIFAALISIPFLLYIEFNTPSNYSFKNLSSILYLGIFPTALAFLIRFHIIKKAGPIFLSYVAYLIPVFAIIWGYLFLGEIINNKNLIGVILVLVGVFLGQKNLMKK